MSGIVTGISNLVASVFEIFKGIIVTIFNIFEGALNAVIGLLKNTFNLAEGVLGFVIGNFFLLGTLAAVYFGYQLLQQRQGKRPAPISKTLTGKTQ